MLPAFVGIEGRRRVPKMASTSAFVPRESLKAFGLLADVLMLANESSSHMI